MNQHIQSNTYAFDSPLGRIAIHTEANQVVKLDFITKEPQAPTNICTKTGAELATYFKNSKHQIKIPINLHGTAFQLRVWAALCDIPAGKTLTYGELAKKLKTSARAVGQACKKNPIPIIVPCHRVVGAKHQGGYIGKTEGHPANIKAWLLAHEAQI